jgi:HTH domain spoOJ/parA/parB/repB family protein
MATVKPFRGIRPPEHLVERIESRPYDVLDSEEARQEAADNEMSLYHITKPEINFGVEVSEFDAQAYDSAKEQFEKFQERGWLVQDDKECYYIYAQTMEGRTQYGLVVCASVHDYVNGVIKKHELTRKDKEENRMKHVRACNANIEPVFFAYPDNTRLNQLIMRYAATKPLYDFVASVDGFRHQFWVISQPEDIKAITDEFASMPALYIADGHHRTAAAALVGAEKGKNDGLGDGEHEHDYFMAVCFQASQLTILDYNRVIKDLNGMSSEEFLTKLNDDFIVEKKGTANYKPQHLHEFSLYLDGSWYSLTARPGTYDDADAIGVLDVDISSRLILDKLMGIKDLRSDNRIDFVGGLRGLDELKKRVDSGECRWALALYPVSMQQIMNIADSGKIMPPKATWFEPKLRSGLVIHKLE